jgi:hypothetical protein
MSFSRLIAEATVLAGGKHECADLGHDWISEGGRRCPRATDDYEPNCSQTVYVCRSCEKVDYGEPGGPGYLECYGDVNTGCSWQCTEGRAVATMTIAGVPVSMNGHRRVEIVTGHREQDDQSAGAP